MLVYTLNPFHKRMHSSKSRFALWVLSLLLGSLVGSAGPAQAQIEPDDLLGRDRSIVTPQNNNPANINITGGAQSGSNLFHSFEDFNVLSDQRVYFVPEMPAVENILSRVTGNNASNILGQLGVKGDASLWLVNPNGIIFGAEATIDVTGSFYATTGSAIALGNGIFSATNPESSQLLSVPPEASFTNYLTVDSGEIVSQGSLTNRRSNLTIAGSNIDLQGELRLSERGTLRLLAYNNIETSRLTAKGSDIDIEAINGSVVVGEIRSSTSDGTNAGNVNITAAENIRTNNINASSVVNRQEAARDAGRGGSITIETTNGGSILNAGVLNAQSRVPAQQVGNASTGGSIFLQATNGGSIINEGTLRSQSDADMGNAGDGGNITIRTTAGNILNRDVLRTQSDTLEGNAGNGGNILLTADDGSITNERALSTQSATSQGNASNSGGIEIMASGNIDNQGLLTAYSFSRTGNTQNGGNITMRSLGGGNVSNQETLRSLSASNGGNVGNGGSIDISVVGEGTINNGGALNAQSLANGRGNAGNGGDITLSAQNGDIIGRPIDEAINNSGSLNTRSATREGNARRAGNIVVTSEGGDITLNAYLDAKSYSINGNSGAGGNIRIEAGQGSITGNAVGGQSTTIITSAVSRGGAIAENADDVNQNSDRNSGTLELTAGDRISGFNIFTLSNLGRSGDVTLEGTEDLTVEKIQVITNEDIVGGDFSFDEDSLFPSNLSGGLEDSNVSIVREGPQSGTPGSVFIRSTGRLVTTDVQIISNAVSSVPAGDIEISSANSSVILDNTSLITRTNGEGRAGDITITSDNYLLLRNGSLLLADAEADQKGGDIIITTNRVIASPDGNNNIITNASSGDGGDIDSPNATFYGFEVQSGSTTEQLRNSRANDISTRSRFGQDGNITFNGIIETPNQIASQELDDGFATPEQLISNSCIAPNSAVGGSFTIPGTGDLPPTPEDSTASVYNLGDVQMLASQPSATAETANSAAQLSASPTAVSKWELGDPVIEPEQIARLVDGRIVFGQSCSVL